MSTITDIEPSLAVKVPNNILGTKAIPHTSNLFESQFLSQVFDRVQHQRVRGSGIVFGLILAVLATQPFLQIKALGTVQWDGVTREYIRYVCRIPVCGELVRDELGINESVPNDIGDQNDGFILVYVVSRRGRNVVFIYESSKISAR